jgi:uncharacterized protein (DUF1697 family)
VSCCSGRDSRTCRTYVQSGNVVLSSDASPEAVAERCEQAITDSLGLEIDVVVRTRDELAEVVRRDPLGRIATEPSRYQVSFLAAALEPTAVKELEGLARGGEQVVAIGREVYAWHPRGVARSRLWARLASRDLGVKATARNWTTVTTLLALADA